MDFQVTLDKESVISTLRHNREEHHKTFLDALEVYRSKIVQELNHRIDCVKNNQFISHTINLPVPEEHTEDYDRVIRMLEAHRSDTIVLSEDDYRTYMENKWSWQRAFLANTTAYAAAKQP